ncbi:MAG TPA: preprotein translocase subunit SecG [Gammaproteobacteria bacterium]|nr:preprotein translocase subunit SecG [Gammaproteobacteria bacterium]
MLYTILEIILVFVAVALIMLILLQQGKGADAGAAFGSGASGTVFGAAGSANFLSRSTGVLATLFFILALTMAYLARHGTQAPKSVVERAAAEQQATPAPGKSQGKPATGNTKPLAADQPQKPAPASGKPGN